MSEELFEAIDDGDLETVRELIRGGVDVNLKHGILEEPALLKAAEEDSYEILDAIVEAGANVDATDFGGTTALVEAARSAKVDFVEALLGAGADPNAPPNMPPLIAGLHDERMREALLAAGAGVDVRDRSGQTPLMTACWRKIPEAAVRLLEAGAEVNAVDDRGRTALIFACMHGQGDVALALVERGADPATRDSSNRAALDYAAWAGLGDVAGVLLERAVAGARSNAKLDLALAIVRSDTPAVGAALAAGAAPTAADPFVKWPPLMWAALAGDDETVRAVLAAGADPNVKRDRQTPVRLLWARGRVAAVLDLVAAGADPNSTVEPYSQPLVAVAAQSGDTAVVRALLEAGAKAAPGALYGAAAGGHVETVRALVAAGAKPDAKDMVDRTPLLRALQLGHVEVARLLVEAGAPLDAKADQTPIVSWSVVAGRHDALDLLLDAGANPNLKDGDGDTPLHLAVRAGDAVAVARLVAAGASIGVKNRAGRSPLAEAAFVGLTSVVEPIVAASKSGAGTKAAFELAALEGEVEAIRALAPLDPKLASSAEARALEIMQKAPEAPGAAESPAVALEAIVEDDLMRGLQKSFLARLPAGSEVVHEGRYGAYIATPPSHLEERNATATGLSTTALGAARVGAGMEAVGFTRVADLVCSRLADVTSRIWAEKGQRAYGAFNVGLLGSQAVDFVTAFDDGAVFTTTTHEDATPMAERGLYPRSYPGVGIAVLWHKHLGRVSRRVAAGARIAPAAPDAAAAARCIDAFLVRRMGKEM